MNKRTLVYNEKKKRKKKHTWGSRHIHLKPCPSSSSLWLVGAFWRVEMVVEVVVVVVVVVDMSNASRWW